MKGNFLLRFAQYDANSKNFLLLIASFLLSFSFTSAQCPDKKLIEKSLAYHDLTDSSINKHLQELLSYYDKIQSCSYRNDSTHAGLVRKIAGLYYGQANYLSAIKYYRESIDIIQLNANKASINLTVLPGIYYWLSACYAALKMNNEKMASLDSCYRIAMRIRYVDQSAARALYNMGEHAFGIGDYNQSIDYMHQCETLSSGLPMIDRKEFLSSSILWQVKALLELKEYGKAEKLLTDRIAECKRSGQINNLGTIYSQFAELQIRRNNYPKALEFYNKSFASDKKAGNNFNCRQTLKDIGNGIYFQGLNDDYRAMSYFSKALLIINKDPESKNKDIMESLDIYRLMADIFVQKNQFDSAHYYFRLAYQQLGATLNVWNVLSISRAELLQNEKVYYLPDLIIDEADAYRSQFGCTKQVEFLRKAILIYKTADQFLDEIKQEQMDLRSKLFWRNDSRRLYENAIQACYLEKNTFDAFYFFEKSKAVLLNDQLNEHRWLNENDIFKETQLEKRAMRLREELTTVDQSSSHVSDLQTELFNVSEEQKDLTEHIKTSNPLYYQSFVDTNVIVIRDVQNKILKDHQALIELFNGDSAVYMIVITKGKSYLQKINKTIFDSLSFVFTNYLSNLDLLNRDFNNYVRLSQQFCQLMFQNINLPEGRIIISPGGKYFPFEALVTSLQPLTYFLDDHAVSYTYSARYLLSTFVTTPADQTFLGVAPLKYSNLPSLGGSDESLTKVQNYFSNATSYIGHDASKNNFLNEFPKYKIIQLYTHAAGNEYSGDPVIYFSDSALNISDLLLEKKPATDLIVLSACETATGKLYSGEGVFSFNRSFAALGIPSSISNLWEIDSRSTYKITELFYKYLSEGMPLDVALQKAKKDLKATSEHKLPYYWAAPILVGKSGAIDLPKDHKWKWIGVASITALFLSGWMIKKRNRSLAKKSSKTKSPSLGIL